MRNDLLHLARSLRRSPAGALAAILTLTLTLGAGTAIFAVVDVVLLTPPPFVNPNALVSIGETPLDEPAGPPRAVAYATLEAWRERARTLASIEAYDPTNLTITNLGAAERTRATDITPGFMALLGVSPFMGRGFTADDVGRPVTIVSYDFWRGRLDGDPGAIGRELVLGGETHTIVGVLPERFTFELDVSEIWRPLPLTPAQAARTGGRVRVIARLAPGVSPSALVRALDEVSRLSTPPVNAAAIPVAAAIAGGSTRTLSLLAGAAALAMLIAFVNLAGLLIVRSVDRSRELAVRSALGARRADVARQLVLEAMALVAAGTIAGVLLAYWITPEVGRLALQQSGGPATREVIVSWRLIAALALVAIACAWICGLVPAVIAARRNVADILRRGVTATPHERWLRRGLVASLVSVAFALLVSVTLLGRSLSAVLAIDPGFRADGLVAAAVALPPARYPTADHLVTFFSTLERELNDRLGPRTAAMIDELPLTNDRGRGLVAVRETAPGRDAAIRVASTAYFDVMRIPIIAGRAFERRADASAPSRVVISKSLATRMFPGESPVGRHIWLADRARSAEIVGIAGDVTHRSLDEPLLPTVYLSMWQFPSRGSRLVFRAARSDADVIAIVREHVRRLDSDMPVYGVALMADALNNSPGVRVRRVLTAAFFGFALLAVALGAIGLFGLVSHDVASRRLELALRVALGADSSHLLNAALGQGGAIVGAGLLAGVVLSYWASQALSAVVAASPLDPINLASASAVLLLASVAALLPVARRAVRTDPLIVLRGE
jgi:putative ABC transport system permease protein